MNIIEATERAMIEGVGIARPCFKKHCYVLPTNTAECYVVIPTNEATGKKPSSRWNPHASDILANDWELTKAEI